MTPSREWRRLSGRSAPPPSVPTSGYAARRPHARGCPHPILTPSACAREQAFNALADGADGSVVRTWASNGSLAVGLTVYHTLRVTNGAGLPVVATSSAVLIVAPSGSSSVVCANPGVQSAGGSSRRLSTATSPDEGPTSTNHRRLRAKAKSGGVPPWWLPALMSDVNLQYDVYNEGTVPQAGRFTSRMRVDLTRLDQWDADKAQLVRMDIAKAADESA